MTWSILPAVCSAAAAAAVAAAAVAADVGLVLVLACSCSYESHRKVLQRYHFLESVVVMLLALVGQC